MRTNEDAAAIITIKNNALAKLQDIQLKLDNVAFDLSAALEPEFTTAILTVLALGEFLSAPEGLQATIDELSRLKPANKE